MSVVASDENVRSLAYFLEAVRRRHVFVTLAAAVLSIGSVTFLAAAVARLAARLGLISDFDPFAADLPWIAALWLFLGVLTSGVLWTVLRRPRLDTVAAWSDERARLDGLARTGLEQAGRLSTPSLVTRAMFQELADRLSGVTPAEIVPHRLKLRLVQTALCGLAFALAMTVPIRQTSTRSVAPVSVPSEAVTVAADLLRLADVLDVHATDEAPLISGFASELRGLAQQTLEGRLETQALASLLTDTLDRLASAAQAHESPLGQALELAFAAAAGSETVDHGGPQPFQFGSSEGATSPTALEAQESGTTDFAADDVFRTLGQVAASMERQVSATTPDSVEESSSSAPSQASDAVASGGYYTDWNEEMALAQSARNAAIRERGQGTAVAGAAERSDDAPGDAAGGGAQPLLDAPSDVDIGELGLGVDVALAATLDEDGRTHAYVPNVLPGSLPIATTSGALVSALVAGREAPVGLERVAVGHRDLITAYFGGESVSGGPGDANERR